jgi:hypothetical protein
VQWCLSPCIPFPIYAQSLIFLIVTTILPGYSFFCKKRKLLRIILLLIGLLPAGKGFSQSPGMMQQVTELIQLSQNNFKEIAGPYDEQRKVWNTTYHLEPSTDNWLLLATEYNFCFFQARFMVASALNPVNEAVQKWADMLRPELKGFNETYFKETKSILNVKYDQYIFHKLVDGSQFVVKVEAIKTNNENFYKASLTVWRQWGDMIKKY